METQNRTPSTLRDWIRELLPGCREVARLQSRTLDETLSFRVRLGLNCHILYCSWCRRYGRQMRFLHQALQSQGDRLAEGFVCTLTPESRQQIKDFLHRETR